MTATHRFASLVSLALHPAVIPTLGLYLILELDLYLKYSISEAYKTTLCTVVFVNTLVFPVILVWLLRVRNMVSDLTLSDRNERHTPYAFTAFLYLFTWYLFKRFGVSPLILSLIFGSTLSVVILFLLNFKWKISAHMTGISGMLGAVVAINLKFQVPMSALIILFGLFWGLVGYSRISLGAHRPIEVYGGALLGFLSVGLSVWLGWG